MPKLKIPAILCDLDGTLCRMNGRGPFEYDKIQTDLCHHGIADILNNYHQHLNHRVILVSGRPATPQCKAQTEAWLNQFQIPYDHLFMRADGDYRSDEIIKKEIYQTFIEPNYTVAFCLDDRQRVVDMWRSLGLLCLQVADGNF